MINDKKTELAQMKRLAGALLLLVSTVYLISSMFEHYSPWVGFVSATAEAAMIGAIADWFAVTALFRHPLGIRIPHTAIIPSRQDAIADQFGTFVQRNFLSEQVISDRIHDMQLGHTIATWLTKPDNAHAIAEQITTGIAGMTHLVNDRDIQRVIEQRVAKGISETSFSPIIGEILSFATSGKRQQDIIDGAIDIASRFLEDSDTDIRNQVSQETPWWFPDTLDKSIYRKIVRSVSRSLYSIQVDVRHPARVRFIDMLNQFMHDLKHSEDFAKKEAAIKQDLLGHPSASQFTQSLWDDIKQSLLKQSDQSDSELTRAIEDVVANFGHTILEDPILAEKIDSWGDNAARYLIRSYGEEISDLIARTIKNWDPVATSERIEIQIGRDLQFIRINGTLVGGLIGLLIHSVHHLLAMLN